MGLFMISGSLAKKEQCESEPYQKKKSILYLVWTKASELADFPGVNTPLNPIGNSCAGWFHNLVKKHLIFIDFSSQTFSSTV